MDERGLSDEEQRFILSHELAGEHYPHYGVEYVAGEFGIEGSAIKKVDEFIDETLEHEDEYRHKYGDFEEDLGDEITRLLEKHGE